MILTKLEMVMSEVTNKTVTLNLTDDITDVIGDSINLIEAVFKIEEHYNIELNDDSLAEIHTIQDLVECIQAALEDNKNV